MDAIWQVALSNAALVAAGTPIVWAVGKFARRPALTHALAVILLLKLITPPLWRVPVAWPERPSSQEPVAPSAKVSASSPAALAIEREVAPPSESQASTELFVREPTHAPTEMPPALLTPPVVVEHHTPTSARWVPWIVPVAQWVWAAGTVLYAAVAARRVIRFSRALRFATRARELQPRANFLAKRLGLRGAPPVWLVPGNVSPMLWSVGRARLLLPQALWDRLDIVERDTILLHELAHWRRGDSVVRWIELLATCVYWWHPACWWARRELREAEEQCCDAWVLWAMPGTFKNYANALLEAVEFVSVGADRPSARGAVPVLASRMGQFVHLRRRLTMLKHGNIARALSWGGLASVMTLGSFVLPVAPTWGQDRPAEPVQERQAPRGGEVDPFGPGSAPEPAPAPTRAEPELRTRLDGDADAEQQQRDAEAKRARADAELARKIDDLKLKHAEKDFQGAMQTIAELKQKLEAAQARIAALEGRGGFSASAEGVPSTTPPMAPPAPRRPLGYAAPVAPPGAPGETRNEKFEYGFDVLPDGPKVRTAPVEPPATKALPGVEYAPGVRDGQYRVIITDPATGRIKEIQTRQLDRASAPPDASQVDRLNKIEAELQMLMGEIKKMRQADARPPAPAEREARP